MPILVGWLQHQAVLQHVVVRGVADVVLDDGVVPVKDGDLARRTVRGAGAPAVGIDRRLQEFTNSVVPLQKRVELTTAGRWGRGWWAEQPMTPPSTVAIANSDGMSRTM